MSRTDYEKAVALGFCEQAREQGFRAFLAKSGTYGFYTDAEGTRVVSFQGSTGGIILSGNYKTSNPRKTGTGWRMGDNVPLKVAFEERAPRWAHNGEKWRYTTLEEHLKAYQKSSQYTEVTDEV